MRHILIAAIALMLSFNAAQATVYDWTFEGDGICGGGPGCVDKILQTTGSGTLTTGNKNGNGFDIIAATGTISTINGLIDTPAVNFTIEGVTTWDVTQDNIFYPASPFVDGLGILFACNNQPCLWISNPYFFTANSGVGGTDFSFVAFQTPVPPAFYLLLPILLLGYAATRPSAGNSAIKVI